MDETHLLRLTQQEDDNDTQPRCSPKLPYKGCAAHDPDPLDLLIRPRETLWDLVAV